MCSGRAESNIKGIVPSSTPDLFFNYPEGSTGEIRQVGATRTRTNERVPLPFLTPVDLLGGPWVSVQQWVASSRLVVLDVAHRHTRGKVFFRSSGKSSVISPEAEGLRLVKRTASDNAIKTGSVAQTK